MDGDIHTNVLLIEDNPGDARLLQEMLREAVSYQFEMVNARSLKEAFELLDEKTFDVIISDLGLPDSQGFETFLKVHNKALELPIIVMTGLADDATGTRAVREGAQDYLVKGQVEGDLLIRTIRYAIERKQVGEALRESEGKYSTLVELSPDAIALLQHGKIIFANRVFYEMFGIPESEVIGKHVLSSKYLRGIMSAMSKDQRKMIMERIADMLKDGIASSNSYQMPLKKQSGEVLWVEVHTNSIVYKGKNTEMAVFRDISDRKQAEDAVKMKNEELQVMGEELRQLNMHLEEKVEERTAEVNNLLRQKDEFVNQLGHDLKSPLTPLVTLLPIIEEREKDAELRELLEVAIENVHFMKELVTKTLSLAKLNSSNTEFTLEVTDLSEEVTTAIRTKLHLFKEKKIDVENKVMEGTIIKADKLRLGELLDNLITNALKYSYEDDGTLIIDAENVDDFVTVSIKDSGIGMTEEQLSNVFEEFYKVDPSRHDLDSSGLGLSICKRIVEKHGGKIWAESPGEGKGTTFYFTIPVEIEVACLTVSSA
ncbi:MAG: ATP-binding protein [Halobacteriota archaeon]|nr:ATP-binding protein [Halobacteriota archaeon]